MKGSTKLFRIFDIDVKIHFSWWFIFALLAWSLSAAFFPHFSPGLSTKTYWFMGITASLLLFVSVLMHELSHSLVAKARNIKVESITLFFFGGVASITDEDMKPMDELQMALAGPALSLFLAGVFYLIFTFNGNSIVSGITLYLLIINLILTTFNLVPAYPLDGGRALRALLHMHYQDLKKATRIAVRGGKLFAGFLIIFGVLTLFRPIQIFGFFYIGGLWFILIGVFLYFIAGMSYEQVVVKDTLAKFPITGLIERKIPKIDSGLTFAQAVKKSYLYGRDSLIVQKGKNFVGILDFKKINKISPDAQKKIKVSQIMVPKSKIKTIDSKANCYQAFRSMLSQNLDLLPVMSNNVLKGVITKKALMHRLVLELKYGFSPIKKNKSQSK